MLASLAPRATLLLLVMSTALLALLVLQVLVAVLRAIPQPMLALVAPRVSGALLVLTPALPVLPVRKELTTLLPLPALLSLLLAPPALRVHGAPLEASTALFALLAKRVWLVPSLFVLA